MKSVYGFTALMESVNSSIRESKDLEDIHYAVNESASFLDIGSKFIGEDEVSQALDVDDDDDVDSDKIENFVDSIPESDDEISDAELKSLEESLEMYI